MNELVSPTHRALQFADRELHVGLRQYVRDRGTCPARLPVGRNSPQKVNYGLYAEQLSGSPFTAPQATNQRSWLYRIRPACGTPAVSSSIDGGLIRTAPQRESELPIGQLRWGPTPLPSEKLTFIAGLRTMTTAGDCETMAGMAAHVALVTAPMVREHFYNADGEIAHRCAAEAGCASAPSSA